MTTYHDFEMNQFNATYKCIIALRHLLLNMQMHALDAFWKYIYIY